MVEARITSATVEIFRKGQPVAGHVFGFVLCDGRLVTGQNPVSSAKGRGADLVVAPRWRTKDM